MNLPAKRRGLSPEGRQIRERHQGSLTIGLQGITVHPAERGCSQRDFLQDSVRRLHEIQARCKERDHNRKPQPLRATRESSASTNSSLKQVEALAPLRNGSAKLGRRSPTSEYEGSAHSDYFSLTDEQIETAALKLNAHNQHNNEQHHTNYSGTENGEISMENGMGHQSRSSSALSQSLPLANHLSPRRESTPRLARANSPVMLRPLSSRLAPHMPARVTSAHRQNSGTGMQLLSGCELNQGMRKMRMDNLLTKIKNQKPSCELDYNTHYKNIENQHKLLLDSSDVLSLYGYGEGSSGTDTQRSILKAGLNTASSIPKTASKLVRAKSFERDSLTKKNMMTGRTEKSGKSSAKAEHRVQSTPSPQLRKRFSKSIGNLSNGNTCPASGQSDQDYSRGSSRVGTESVYNSEYRVQSPQSQIMSDVQSLQRSKSNLESLRRYNTSMNSNANESSHIDSDMDLCSQSIRGDRINSVDKRATLNRTSLSGDLNLNSTMSSDCNFNINDPDHSVLSGSALENLHLDLRSESQAEGDVTIQDNGKHSVMHNSPGEYHPEVYMKPYNDTVETEHAVDAVSLQERATSSTPVPNAPQELPSGSSLPKLLKKREQQEKPPSPSTLRRSQSLKNIRQRQGEPPSTYKRGKLPKYLLARKEEEKRLAEIARSVDPECPPGHAPLPDHERRNTLHLLRKSQAEVMRELSSLPVAQDTLRVKKKRQDLEDKLMQIEDGLRIFSQPKVYVMNDD